ncbi:MAG: HAD family hydrolase [Candidatus Helarchaeota archaeon]
MLEVDSIILGIIISFVVGIISVYFSDKNQKVKEKGDSEEDLEQIFQPFAIGNSHKEKIGIIFSDLEGTLTEEVSFWEKLNLEMGISKEEDNNLYELFMDENTREPDVAYSNWMNRIFTLWKKYSQTNSQKFNKNFIQQFSRQYLKVKEGAKEFIQRHKNNFIFYVISGAPPEFCELAQKELGFDYFTSTNILEFEKNGMLKKINGDPDGFRKERIIKRIRKELGFDWRQVIAIGDSENDFTMLNQAGMGILVGMHLTHLDYKECLRPEVVQFEDVDYQKISRIIEEYTIDIQSPLVNIK